MRESLIQPRKRKIIRWVRQLRDYSWLVEVAGYRHKRGREWIGTEYQIVQKDSIEFEDRPE
jgi:hypothetical protein